ncbi:MAG: hypothetical protein R2854_17260 [Caldilineaceae bacterium]
MAASLGPHHAGECGQGSAGRRGQRHTDGWGADIVFGVQRQSAHRRRSSSCSAPAARSSTWACPPKTIQYDVVHAATKEARTSMPFWPRMSTWRAGAFRQRSPVVKPLITDTFAFADSVEAFDFAVNMPATSVKAQIEMG